MHKSERASWQTREGKIVAKKSKLSERLVQRRAATLVAADQARAQSDRDKKNIEIARAAVTADEQHAQLREHATLVRGIHDETCAGVEQIVDGLKTALTRLVEQDVAAAIKRFEDDVETALAASPVPELQPIPSVVPSSLREMVEIADRASARADVADERAERAAVSERSAQAVATRATSDLRADFAALLDGTPSRTAVRLVAEVVLARATLAMGYGFSPADTAWHTAWGAHVNLQIGSMVDAGELSRAPDTRQVVAHVPESRLREMAGAFVCPPKPAPTAVEAEPVVEPVVPKPALTPRKTSPDEVTAKPAAPKRVRKPAPAKPKK